MTYILFFRRKTKEDGLIFLTGGNPQKGQNAASPGLTSFGVHVLDFDKQINKRIKFDPIILRKYPLFQKYKALAEGGKDEKTNRALAKLTVEAMNTVGP